MGPDGKFGRINIVKHSIDTGDSKPIKIPPRRLPYAQKSIVENEIQKMLDNDIIEILEDFAFKAKERNIDIKLYSERGIVKNPDSFIEFFKLSPKNV